MPRLVPHAIVCLRPLLPLALALSLGQILGALPGGAALLLVAALLSAAALRFSWPLRPRKLAPLFLLCLLASGLLSLHLHAPARRDAIRLHGETILVQGTVVSMPNEDLAYSRVYLRQASGRKIALRAPSRDLNYGETIAVKAEASRPTSQRNPGGFDRRDWLWRQGIYLEAQPAPGASVKTLQEAPRRSLMASGHEASQALQGFLRRSLPRPQADLLAAILLGNRQALDAKEQTLFRKAGLAHLTAVSGLHVSLLLLPLQKLLAFGRRGLRYGFLLFFLLAYGFLTGFPVSLGRVLLMNGAVIGGKLLRRPTEPFSNLILAAFVLLLMPHTALSLGFWLSLLATGAILTQSDSLAAWLRQKLPFLSPWLALLCAVPLCAQLVTLPLSLSLSGEIVWFGLLSNLPATFLVQAILLGSLLGLPAAFLLERVGLLPLVEFVLLPLRGLLSALSAVASFFGRSVPWRLQEGRVSLPFVLLAIFLLLAATGLGRRLWQNVASDRLWPGFRRRALLVLGLSLLFFELLLPLTQPRHEAFFLDVGQGDAFLLRPRHGPTLLYDGGPSGRGFDVLLPAMDALAIPRVDLAIASHAHDDHLGGIVDLMRLGRVRTLVLPKNLVLTDPDGRLQARKTPEEASDALVAEALAVARRRGVKVQTLKRHDTMRLSSDIKLKVLHPPLRSVDSPAPSDGNEDSLVLHLKLGAHELLLTGDLTGSGERELLQKDAFQPAQVLKVAHHGAADVTSDAFLQTTRPQAALIGVGEHNRYGHPAPEVLKQLDRAGCQAWRTDRHGAIRWQGKRQSWSLATIR